MGRKWVRGMEKEEEEEEVPVLVTVQTE